MSKRYEQVKHRRGNQMTQTYEKMISFIRIRQMGLETIRYYFITILMTKI